MIMHCLSCSRDISGAVMADKERCKHRQCWINNAVVHNQTQKDIVVHPFCQCLSDTNQYIYLCTCISCKKETLRMYFSMVFFPPKVKMKASKGCECIYISYIYIIYIYLLALLFSLFHLVCLVSRVNTL